MRRTSTPTAGPLFFDPLYICRGNDEILDALCDLCQALVAVDPRRSASAFSPRFPHCSPLLCQRGNHVQMFGGNVRQRLCACL